MMQANPAWEGGMNSRLIGVSLAAAAMMATPAALFAQQVPVRQAQAPKARQTPRAQPANPDPEVEELTPSQIQREQDSAPPPAAKDAGKTSPKQAAPVQGRAIACSGAFAKDSNHLKLATVFNSLNVTFTEVDGPEASKLMASVLFPKDPKRRLEVWWLNEATRSGTYLIVINGQSTWSAPKGLKLGLQLAALEKLNGKPFKLKGFDKENSSTITDWDGGALTQFPGGCKSGVRLVSDAKAPQEARDAVAAGSEEFLSTDAKVRAVKPTVAEIILGY
jgi:hypothetical protein